MNSFRFLSSWAALCRRLSDLLKAGAFMAPRLRRGLPRLGASAGLSSEGIYKHLSKVFVASCKAPIDASVRLSDAAPDLPLAIAAMEAANLHPKRTPFNSREPECSGFEVLRDKTYVKYWGPTGSEWAFQA